MTITWQDAATVCIVLAAAAYLIRYAAQLWRRKGMPRCGRCQKCQPPRPEKPLVGLDQRREVFLNEHENGIAGKIADGGQETVARRGLVM